MAEVYKRVKGKPITKVIAQTREAQEALDDMAGQYGAIAAGLLAGHRAEGHAKITIDHGDIDYYVSLDDERGLLAALSIEYGRAAHADDDDDDEQALGGMEGLFILHRTFGLRGF